MKLRRNKKGFTIIELVIVIAVIGILTAVLVPVFINLTAKANEAADDSLVKNLNTALKMEEVLLDNPKNETLQDAIDDLENEGYILENLISKSGKDLLWSQSENQFYLNKEGTYSGKDYWQIVNEIPETQKYSYYAGKQFKDTTVATKYGFDAGNNQKIESISYERIPDSADAGTSIAIRTNGGSLSINAPYDVVKHFGYADEVNISEIRNNSYHEHGTVPFLQVKKGRVVLENASKVSHIHIERKDANSFDEIVVAKSAGSVMPNLSRDPVTIGSSAVLVVEVESSGSSEYVWLEGNGTIEDSKVLVSSTKDGEKTAVTESTAAEYVKQVANNKVGDDVIEGGKTADEVEAIKNEVIDEYYDNEFIPTGVPESAVSYIYDRQTKELKTFTDLNLALEAAADGETITICKDFAFTELFELSDKSVTIVGQKNMKPLITGDIYIHHTSGNHNVKFSNLRFLKNSSTEKNYIRDSSVCTSQEDVNNLTFENCEFDATEAVTIANKHALVSIQPTNNITGTAFIFKNNEVAPTSGGEYAYIICAGCSADNNKTDPASHKRNIVQPIIDGNHISMNYSDTYVYIGSSAKISNNKIENVKKVAQFYGVVPVGDIKGQLDVSICGNTFEHIKGEIFKVYWADKIGDDGDLSFEIKGSEGADANTFIDVPTLADIGGDAAAFGTQLGIELSGIAFEGIASPTVNVKLASVILSKYGELETGHMTLPNGKQVMTYTQPLTPEDGRTGYYIDINSKRLWFFADKTSNEHFFIDNDNHVYVVRLVSGGSTTISNCVLTNTPEPEAFSDADNGKFYNASFVINTFDGNTLYNASASQDGNKVTVSALDGKTAAEVNLFISNIGEKSKLLITNNASATADSDTLIYVVPEGTGQVNVYGEWDVTIDANIVNYQANNRQTITVNEGKSVTGSLTITGSAAKESVLTNNGNIGKVNFNTKASLVNNGTINSVNVVDLNTKATVVVTEYVINAYESSIVNNGTINFVGSSTKITLTNNEGAEIGGLWLTVAADNEDVYSRAVGSVIVNNGTMAAMNKRTIDINVRCTFTNNGVIGKEGRGTEGDHSETGCENYGGTIYIGNYSGGSLHDGLIFVNNGTIYAGARHNGNSHQQVTFWICGSKNKVVNITVSNTATINGRNWRTTFGNAANVSGITIDNDMGN